MPVELNSVSQIEPEIVEKLNNKWITTAEQLISVSAVKGGVENLALELEVSEERLLAIIQILKKRIDPDYLKEIEKEADTSEFGLGANEPDAD